MDERQQQIRERAGLEESRLNQELIDWLRRWSTPILMAIAAVALGYFLYNRMEHSRRAEVGRAYAELEAAARVPNPSPDSLRAIAEQYADLPGVAAQARLAAADTLLGAARKGIQPYATLNPDGSLVNPEDAMTDEQRQQALDEAEALYRQVLADAERRPGAALHEIGALFGLAAVAESRGDLDTAKEHYQRLQAVADRSTYPDLGRIAQDRIDTLPSLANPPRLYAQAELPELPWADEAPELPELPEGMEELIPPGEGAQPAGDTAAGPPTPAAPEEAEPAPEPPAPAGGEPAPDPQPDPE